jgi:hypothetical protein
MMGEGRDGGGRPGPYPPPESSPTVGGRTIFLAQLEFKLVLTLKTGAFGIIRNSSHAELHWFLRVGQK